MEKLDIKLRAVFYRDGDEWAAHCLEMDIVGHGETRREAFQMMDEAIWLQLQESLAAGNLRNLFMPADPRIFEMWAAGHEAVEGGLTFKTESLPEHIQIHDPEAREYEGPTPAAA